MTEEKNTVTMIFPKNVKLVLDDRRILEFEAGVHEVPEEFSRHWWLKAHGVKKYKVQGNEPVREAKRLVNSDAVEFLRAHGYRPPTVNDAQDIVNRMEPEQQTEFYDLLNQWVAAGKPEVDDDDKDDREDDGTLIAKMRPSQRVANPNAATGQSPVAEPKPPASAPNPHVANPNAATGQAPIGEAASKVKPPSVPETKPEVKPEAKK